MAKYMEPMENVLAQLGESVTAATEPNHDHVLDLYGDLQSTGEHIISTVRVDWRNGALKHVGSLGVQAADIIAEANDNGTIVPPLSDGEIAVLSMKRTMFAGLTESAAPKESKAPTPTERIDTDLPKA